MITIFNKEITFKFPSLGVLKVRINSQFRSIVIQEELKIYSKQEKKTARFEKEKIEHGKFYQLEP